MKGKVAVLFGGRSVEHEVSLNSARTVTEGLLRAGYKPLPIGITEDGCWLDVEASDQALFGGAPRLPALNRPLRETVIPFLKESIDVVFPVVHGTWGEDGTLQGFLEILDLPYVGAGVTPSAIAMDKIIAKRLLVAAGLPVVDFCEVTLEGFRKDSARTLKECEALPFPVFVKPSVGGSSVGVRKVKGPSGLAEAIEFALKFDDKVLVERGIEGRELEISVLGYRELEVSAIGEIVPGRDFYDYEDKYLGDQADLIAPAPLEPFLERHLSDLAQRAFAAMGGWGLARVDFLLEGHTQLFINEINTLPGFTDISMYPRLWKLSGVHLPDLVDRLVQIALKRHEDRRSLDRGIQGFLAELDSSAENS